MADTPIQVVDENDEPIGAATIVEARQTGAFHRISRVMVEDTKGRILLQKRSMSMEAWPGYWDNSAAGHVDYGETYEVAAVRELQEEIGIKDIPLKEVAYYRTNGKFDNLMLNRFNKLFLVRVPEDTVFSLQQSEVSEVRWFTRPEFKELVGEGDAVTDGLIEAFARLYK